MSRTAYTAEAIVRALTDRGGVIVAPPYSDAVEVRVLLLRHDPADPSTEEPMIALSDLASLLAGSGCNYDCDNCHAGEDDDDE